MQKDNPISPSILLLAIGGYIPVLFGSLAYSGTYPDLKLAQVFMELHYANIPVYIATTPLLFIALSNIKNKIATIYIFPLLVSLLSVIFYEAMDLFGKLSEDINFIYNSIINSLVFSYFWLFILSLPMIFNYHLSDIKISTQKNNKIPYKAWYAALAMFFSINSYALFFHHENYNNAQVYGILVSIVFYLSLYFYFLSRAIYKKIIDIHLLFINNIAFFIVYDVDY